MDAVEELAWRLCSGAQEDYVRDLSERMADMLERGVRNPDEYRVLASRSREAALAVWAEHEGEVTAEARAAFMEAMSDADDDLVGALQAAYPDAAGLTNRGNAELKQAARGMAKIIARDNVSFADGQVDTFNAAVAEAVTSYEMGDDYRAVMERAVRRMSSLGTVDYKNGMTSQIDVLVRRHIVTQAEQARARDTVERCREYGHDLVMVDTHYGARPSHAVWQGKVYSLSGRDKHYPGLREATGYGTVGGLAGANCRHFMTPYVPGLSQIPDVTPGWEKKYGMSSDDYYKVTQRQRAMERRVRALKRTVAMGQERGLDMTDDRYRLGDAQARLREHCERYGLQRDYERERAYGVSQQPVPLGRGKTTGTLTEFLDSEETKTLIRSSGLSLKEGNKAIRDSLDEAGVSDIAFSHQSHGWKRTLRRRAVASRVSSKMAADEGQTFGGNFGSRTKSMRKAYSAAGRSGSGGRTDARVALFNERTGASLELGSTLSGISKKKQDAIFSGMELAIGDLGIDASRIKLLVSEGDLGEDMAKTERVGDDIIMRVSARSARHLDEDQMEQIGYHEIAHVSEHAMLSRSEWERQSGDLIRFRDDGGELRQTKASSAVQRELESAGIPVEYNPEQGKILFKDTDSEEYRSMHDFSAYAFEDAEVGSQDSELIAECIRYVGVHGKGNSAIADAVYSAVVDRRR